MSAGLRAGTNNDGFLQINGTDVLTALSSGLVGIGTTNPTSKLTVVGDVSISGVVTTASLIPTGSTVPANGVYLPGTNTLGFAANSNERLTIDGTGRVIFKVPPAVITTGPGGVTGSGGFYVTSNPSDTTFSISTLASGLGSIVSLSAGQSINQAGGRDLGLDADQIIFSKVGTERARINSSGNVGIGTTNPQNPLHISGSPGTLLRIDGGVSGTGTRDIVITESNTTAYGGIIRYDSAADLFTVGTIENSVVKNALNVSRTSGHITTPFQPTFYVEKPFGATNTFISGNTTAINTWSNVGLNQGSHFSLATGRFTAPVAGIYMFTFHISYGIGANSMADFLFIKNGIQASETVVAKNGTVALDWANGALIAHISLAVNDYVAVGTESYSGNTGSMRASFGGRLVG